MKHHRHNHRDEALARLALHGDRDAFGELLLRHYPSILRLCHRLLGSAVEAQDIAQEAALQAMLNLTRLHDPARFGAWLHAIAANLARMALRRRRALSLDALPDGTRVTVLWAVGAPSPEESFAAREIHDAIIAALGDLSTINREVVIRFYLEGYSYSELAALLRVPVSTIKGRLFFGRRQLRQALQPVAEAVLAPRRRLEKEHVMEMTERVEMKLIAIRVHSLPNGGEHSVAVLREASADRILPIWIGRWEADAIKMALEGQPTPRPMTHDLTLRLLQSFGAQVRQVVINKLAEKTFYAEIQLDQGGQTSQVDARPSDALALAARSGTPIYVARAVLDEAGGADDQDAWAQRIAAIGQC